MSEFLNYICLTFLNFVLFFERTARELHRDFYLTRKRETKILQETPRPSALTRRPVLRMNKTNRVKQPLPQLEKQKKKETATTLKKTKRSWLLVESQRMSSLIKTAQ